jgi:hypothetical protein
MLRKGREDVKGESIKKLQEGLKKKLVEMENQHKTKEHESRNKSELLQKRKFVKRSDMKSLKVQPSASRQGTPPR